MSDSKSNDVSFVGTPVRFSDTGKEALDLDWDEGFIAAVFTTERGVGVHVVNPETGVITPAVGMEAIEFLPATIEGLRLIHKMQQAALEQVAEMFSDD